MISKIYGRELCVDMQVCYIVGAGDSGALSFSPGEQDMVIAADAGYARLAEAGIKADLIIGDFDSLGSVPGEDNVIVLPAVKDVTDTWAAVEQGLRRGYKKFVLYGCTGGRFDHTMANLQTAAYLAGQGMECRMIGRTQTVAALSAGMELVFEAEKTGYISVFSHTDCCEGVTIRGLKYELEAATLTNRFPLGVSNEFTGRRASISVTGGIALVVYDRD